MCAWRVVAPLFVQMVVATVVGYRVVLLTCGAMMAPSALPNEATPIAFNALSAFAFRGAFATQNLAPRADLRASYSTLVHSVSMKRVSA